MPNKNNTARGNKRVDSLIKRIRQNVANNDLRFRAHNKVNHFTKPELLEFLGVKEFVSKLFQKTKTLTIPKSPELFTVSEDTVMTFLKSVLEREARLKNVVPFIDKDLWNYFNGKTVLDIPKGFITVVYRFIPNLTHKQILEEAENTGIKKVYSYLEGLSIICKVILFGEVDIKGTGVIVYFKVDGVDTLYRFRAYRIDGGQLYVDVGRVNPDYEWSAGNGVCFSN